VEGRIKSASFMLEKNRRYVKTYNILDTL